MARLDKLPPIRLRESVRKKQSAIQRTRVVQAREADRVDALLRFPERPINRRGRRALARMRFYQYRMRPCRVR